MVIDMMTIEEIKSSLDDISNRTDFFLDVLRNNAKKVDLSVHGDNPEGEDWYFEITIKTPETEEDLAKSLSKEFWDLYNDYDVEENVYMWLEAKRNGTSGVPGVVDLVHNEEYKEKALRDFAERLELMY